MSGRTGMKHYELEIKREAVRMFLEEHHTYVAIAKKLGIRKAARIEVCIVTESDNPPPSAYRYRLENHGLS